MDGNNKSGSGKKWCGALTLDYCCSLRRRRCVHFVCQDQCHTLAEIFDRRKYLNQLWMLRMCQLTIYGYFLTMSHHLQIRVYGLHLDDVYVVACV